MIEDWYFCAAMRDTPHATHSYLALLDALDAPDGLADLLPDTLAALSRCEPWTALHAAPRLLRLAADGGDGANRCLDHLLETVRSTVGATEVADSLCSLLRVCSRDDPSRAAAELRATAAAWGEHANPVATAEPFRDLTRYPLETLLLAGTAHLASRTETVGGVRAALRGDGSVLEELTNRALKHEYGRLPFLLAVRALGESASGQTEREQLLKALCEPRVGWAHLEPDLMAAAARLLHPSAGLSPEQHVAGIDVDAVTTTGLRRLRRLRGDHDSGTPVQRILDRLGISTAEIPPALSAVLWQQTVWDLAASLHPGSAASVLARRWAAPGGQPTYPQRFAGPVEPHDVGSWARDLTALWQLRIGATPVAASTDGTTPVRLVWASPSPALKTHGMSTWAFSPWIDRAQPGWGWGQYADTETFPGAHDPVALLRLLSSVRTAVRLLRHGGEAAHPLVDLVMHGTEVLAEGRRGRHMLTVSHGGEHQDDPPLPHVLVPLAFSAYRASTYALRGVYPELHPALFAERAISVAGQLTEKGPGIGADQRLYRQAQLLHKHGGALHVLVQGVLEALSGFSGPRDGSPQSRWFDGEPALAERLLRQAAQSLDARRHRREVANALLILRLLLRQDVTDRRLSETRDPRSRPTFQEVLLAPGADFDLPGSRKQFEAWVKRSHSASVKLCWATVRLLHGMEGQQNGGGTPTPVHDLVEAWVHEMEQIRATKDLPRLARWSMLALFDIIRIDDEHGSRVLDKLLDVFTEFGLTTPMDQRVLFGRLVDTSLPSHIATRMRTRLLSLSYDGRLAPTRRDHGFLDVWERGMRRHTTRSLERQFNWLVRNLTREDTPEARENRTFIRESWQKSVLTSSVRSTSVSLSETEEHPPTSMHGLPDPRSRVALLSYETSDRAVLHWLPVDLELPEHVDLFREPDRRDNVLQQTRRGQHSKLVGVVCGQTADNQLLINCGLGQPLEADPYQGASVGDPVGVTLEFEADLDRAPLSVAVKGAPEKLPMSPRPGDVRRVRVTLSPEKGVAEVAPLDTSRETDHTGPLAEWDPDLSRRFGRQREDEPALVTVARYESGDWHPVHRGFTEFLATELPYQEGTAAVLTLIGHEDTEEGRVWRFGLRPGQSFVLPERVWEPAAAERLRVETADFHDPAGLRCWVRVADDEAGMPTLALTNAPDEADAEENPGAAREGVDRRNLEWRELCASGTVRATRSDGRWRVGHSIPGFPEVIVEDMPALATDVVDQAITGWDEPGLRTGRVRAQMSPHTREEKATPAEFRSLHDLRPGDVVRLGAGGAARRGGLRAWTVSGNVEVTVEADSALLRPARETDAWKPAVRGRDAVITRVDPGRSPAARVADRPVRDTDLLSSSDPDREQAGVGQALTQLRHMPGVLLSAPQEGSGQLPRVWLLVDDHVLDLHIPWSAFTETTWHSGDRVMAFRSEQGWSFAPCGRRVFARCLWNIREGLASGAPVGVLEGAGPSFNAAEVSSRSGALTHSAGRRERAESEIRAGQVALRPFFTDPVDNVQRHRVEVLLPGNRSIWGFTDVRYETESAWQVREVRLRARPVDQGGRQLWDVRRVFELAPATEPGVDGDQAAAWPIVAAAKSWNAELRDGYAVLAPVQFDGGRRRVSLPPVPLVGGEVPHVEGASYAPRTARVVLKAVDGAGEGSWLASYRDVPAVSVRAFKDSQNIVEGRETETSLYFVGTVSEKPGQPHADWLLFEWGFGRTLRVHRDEVTLDDRPLQGKGELPLFHGDQVTRITLTPRAGRGDGKKRSGLWFGLHGDGIRWSQERGLRSQAGQGIVPRLTVRVNRAAGTAEIIGVEARRGSIDSHEQAGENPSEVRSPRLQLDSKGTAALLRHYPSGPDVVRVLGRLDTERWDSTGGRHVIFQFVRPSTGRDDPHAIRPGQHVFMWADRILRHNNDITLDLSLDLGPVTEPQPITARVTRRAFAHREDLLRRIVDEGGPKALEGTPYLVELRRQREERQFEGRISKSPTRSASALRGYLTARNPSCFAVVTRPTPALLLELRAGVHVALSPEDLAEDRDLDVGTVVRVTRADGHRFRLLTALPSDRAYAVDGREAVVFPKNPLLSGRRPERLEDPLFTTSGLPNVQLFVERRRPEEDLLIPAAELMRHPHPKIGRLRVREARSVVEAPGEGQSDASWLSIDPHTLESRLTPVVPDPDQSGESMTLIEPAQTSFADSGARRIAERYASARQLPHDSLTGYWPEGLPESVVRVNLDDQVDGPTSTEPVVPGAGPTLRYDLREARKFGFPADHLMDRRSGGAAASSVPGRASDWYVVAGPITRDGVASGLWLELSPGRLVEVPAELMHAAAGSTLHPLDDLRWDLIQPGDEVEVSAHHRNISEPACVVLHGWRPGLRGALGSVPALLTIQSCDHDAGTLRLGGGPTALEYPVSRGAASQYTVGSTVRLTPDNRLTVCPNDFSPSRDDAVLLGIDEGTGLLSAYGLPGLTVTLDEAGWVNEEWLREELTATPQRAAAVLAAIGGALPVTVAGVDSDGGLRVSRSAQPRLPSHGPWESLARVTGRLVDGRLVLRSGGALLAARPDQLVPGLPPHVDDKVAAVGTAADEPSGSDNAMWLHRRPDGGLRTGLRADQPGERRLLPLAAVSGAGTEDSGLLCREEDSGALRWLPAEHSAWAELTTEQLHSALVAPGTAIRAAILSDGRASATSSSSARSYFNHLGVGDPVRLVVLGAGAEKRSHGRWRYLARLEANDMIVFFTSSSSKHPENARLIGEVDRLTSARNGTVLLHTVRRNERGTVPDLPSVVMSASKPSVRFDRYYELCSSPNLAISDGPEPVAENERVVRAAWLFVLTDCLGELPEESSAALRRWLDLFTTDASARQEIDLLPLLGATLLAAAEGTSDPECARTAVWLAHHAGTRALRAVHVDPMVGSWLGRGQAVQGLWGRLSALGIQAWLKPEDQERLTTFCRGRRYRAAVEKDSDLYAIALGLLASVEEPVPLDAFLESPGMLTELASFSRGLVPPNDRATAQDRLHPGQVNFLAQTFEAILRGKLHAVLPGLPKQFQTELHR
ncbi:hypothetical protein ACFQ69_27090 [Streptomyces sp. NPDC056470]|uniref:hypothetical protein n=1 Tax=Streptomyces sp. NPDC056470 TaxID=3345831 RepID=UPI0036C5BDDB